MSRTVEIVISLYVIILSLSALGFFVFLLASSGCEGCKNNEPNHPTWAC